MKRLWILGLVIIVVLGIIFIPKLIFNQNDNTVNFDVIEENEVPERINEILPQYKVKERALACRVDNSVYVIVTRGEKRTDGYSVSIDKIIKNKVDDHFNLVVYAKFKDPGPNEIVPQVITYPYTIVKTNLDELPKNIKLEVEYED